jgi:hypothetical protein
MLNEFIRLDPVIRPYLAIINQGDSDEEQDYRDD